MLDPACGTGGMLSVSEQYLNERNPDAQLEEILEVGGKDLCRVHVKPSSFPVEAEVVEVDGNGQHLKNKFFYGRFGNGTRGIKDPVERERYKLQVWGP